MSEEILKKILLISGYTQQTDKEAVYDYIQKLKKQLHNASIEIQKMIEQDIECPRNCSKLKELKKRLEVGEKQYNDVVEKMEKQREVIDKAIEYINEYAWKEDIIGDMYTVTGKPMVDKYMQLEWDNCKELLDILSKVE